MDQPQRHDCGRHTRAHDAAGCGIEADRPAYPNLIVYQSAVTDRSMLSPRGRKQVRRQGSALRRDHSRQSSSAVLSKKE
ncbi:MAG: hypothetical protein BGP05_00825 [Rhizobiales bacterium 62-47]|nr:MAG: hypothetical protein BGP05_00825 [Rhizobiales bacterium 62-47]